MSKLSYKGTKDLVMRWKARITPNLASLGLLSVSGGGFKPKGHTDNMKRTDLMLYEAASLSVRVQITPPNFLRRSW
jgi:hypothetical protein